MQIIATTRPSIFPDHFVNQRSKDTKWGVTTLCSREVKNEASKRCNLNEVERNCIKLAKPNCSADLHCAQNKFRMQQSSHRRATHSTSPSEVDQQPAHKKISRFKYAGAIVLQYILYRASAVGKIWLRKNFCATFAFQSWLHMWTGFKEILEGHHLINNHNFWISPQ